MVNDNLRILLKDLSLDKITIGFFKENLGLDFTKTNLLLLLNSIIEEKNDELLRGINSFFFKTSFIPESCEIYNKLLLLDWHTQHDDIAGILQFNLNCPCSAIYLAKSINLKFQYLFEIEAYESFVTKCMWGISKVGTEHSKEILIELSNSNDDFILNAAKFQLQRLGIA